MAAIDKIYGTNAQFKELKEWLIENKPDALKYLYDFEYEKEPRTISNFTEAIDMWLLENCPLTWVTDRIKEQYGYERNKV